MPKPDLPTFNGRTLKNGSKGKRVRALQQALRDHYHQKLRVDGEYGPKTAAAVRRFQRHRPPLEVDGVVGQRTWHAIRTHVQKVDGWRKIRARESKGAVNAVKWGLTHNGWHEQGFNNNAPWMPALFSRFGWHPGYAWCQYGADAILFHATGTLIPSGYTPAVLQWGKEGRYGLRYVGRTSSPKPGDFLYYKWPGVSGDTCDHVGVYAGGGISFEANTSPGNGGSQNDGGGWYKRSFAARYPFLVGVVRPDYLHKHGA